MTCIPAPACKDALEEATKRWPNRKRGADGICSSPEHRARDAKLGINSDHDTGDAFDLTHDPAHGVDCAALAAVLIARRDPRVKYLIWNRMMWRSYDRPATKSGRPFLKAWISEPYTVAGGDPHTGHLHVSIVAGARNVRGAWWTTPSQEDDMAFGPEEARKLDEVHAWLDQLMNGVPARAVEALPVAVSFTHRTVDNIARKVGATVADSDNPLGT